MKKQIIIGSRGSELALWQANFIKKELLKKNKSLSVEIKVIKTKGDKILDVALSKIGDKNLFTKEIENELLDNSIDLAVHSLKDLQTKLPEGLTIGAVTKRHKVEDVLIARKKGMTIHKLPEGAVIGTGSLRRRCQLLHMRPDIKIEELRGNVPSRIEKFHKSDWDGIILACAGVERLKLNKHISSYISTEDILPAVGQGALAIEIRDNDDFMRDIVSVVHDDNTFAAVNSERALLKRLEGGCQVPIGAFAEVKANGLYLDALVGSIDGTVTYRKKIKGSKNDAEKLGESLADDLLKAGADEILEEIYSSLSK